jgi:hypothetical protein
LFGSTPFTNPLAAQGAQKIKSDKNVPAMKLK